MSESWVTETYSTCPQLLLECPCKPKTGKKAREQSWEPGLSLFREGLSWRCFAWTSFFGPMCILWKDLTRLRPKEVKHWYVCLCWDPWVQVDRREKWKLKLHQIRRTDKWLLSIGAVLRQRMASERKDWVSVYFLELGFFCLFFESFMTCWNTVLHNSFSPSVLLSGFCSA